MDFEKVRLDFEEVGLDFGIATPCDEDVCKCLFPDHNFN